MLIQILLSIILLASLWLIWRRVRQAAVGRGVAALWTLGALIGLVITWIPDVASRAADLFGVGRGADLVVYLALLLLFLLVFQLYVSHVKLQRDLTELVRKDALKEEERV